MDYERFVDVDRRGTGPTCVASPTLLFGDDEVLVINPSAPPGRAGRWVAGGKCRRGRARRP